MNDKDLNLLFAWWIITVAVFSGVVALIATCLSDARSSLKKCTERLAHAEQRLVALRYTLNEQAKAINAVTASVKSLHENHVKDKLS